MSVLFFRLNDVASTRVATRVDQTSGGAVCTSLMGRGLTTHEESNRRDKLSLMKPRLLRFTIQNVLVSTG